MPVRDLLNRTLPLLIAQDRRPTVRAQVIYNAMRCVPKTYIANYGRILGLHKETIRRAVRELIAYGWAYTYPHA